MKDDNIIFDFIQHKMLKLNERVIYAGKQVYTSGYDDVDDEIYYKVITLTNTGHVTKYIKFLSAAETGEWIIVNTM